MNHLEDFVQEIIDDLKKNIPDDVIKDLEELARLDGDVQICLIRNQIVDIGKIKRINELVRKHFYLEEEQENQNEPVGSFDFGEAIRRLKNGSRMARSGWNGKGMFVTFCPAGGEDYTLSDGMKVTRRDYLYMKAADDTVVPWVASQTDILACDWYEVERGENNA